MTFSMPVQASIQCHSLFNTTTAKGSSIFVNSKKEAVAFRIDGHSTSEKVILFLNGIDKNLNEWDRLLALMLKRDPTAAYVRIDLFGQGETSDMNPLTTNSISYKRQIQLLQNFISSQGFQNKDLTLISHSYGGAIASKYIQQNPDVVKKNIMISPFIDNLEIHQPGFGPFLAWTKYLSELTGLKGFYDLNIQLGASVGTVLTWPSYQLIRNSESKLHNVLALSEGVRDVEMNQSAEASGSTQTSIIYARLDELIPASGHLDLWEHIPEASRGSLLRIAATHESVLLNTPQVFEAVTSLLP